MIHEHDPDPSDPVAPAMASHRTTSSTSPLRAQRRPDFYSPGVSASRRTCDPHLDVRTPKRIYPDLFSSGHLLSLADTLRRLETSHEERPLGSWSPLSENQRARPSEPKPR
jgi:hypothetical protein